MFIIPQTWSPRQVQSPHCCADSEHFLPSPILPTFVSYAHWWEISAQWQLFLETHFPHLQIHLPSSLGLLPQVLFLLTSNLTYSPGWLLICSQPYPPPSCEKCPAFLFRSRINHISFTESQPGPVQSLYLLMTENKTKFKIKRKCNHYEVRIWGRFSCHYISIALNSP